MLEGGSRRRSQPAPPHIVLAKLAHPTADPVRPWLHLLPDEQVPEVITAEADGVTWSTLWPHLPDAVVHFHVERDAGSGSVLRWTLWLDEPLPDSSLLGHLRKRLNTVVNADLRNTFGQ